MRFLEEDSTSIVPIWHIEDKEELQYGGSCRVKWSNKKYTKLFDLFRYVKFLNELLCIIF